MQANVSSSSLVVLVVEDEPLLRMLAIEMLEAEGIDPIEAEHADDAIAILQGQAEGVHILFTDINMPGPMNGVELAHHVQLHWPWIGLLVTSSAPPHGVEHHLPPGARFAAKPYSAEHIIGHVRELATA